MSQVIRTSLCFTILGMAAVPSSFAQDTAPRERSATNRSLVLRKSPSSYLGIGVAEIDAERARALNLKEVHGVEVKSVDRDSPAAKAGLKESDVVLEYNGQRIEGAEQFIRLVRETPIDRQVKLSVWRNGGAQTLTATIGHRKDQFFFASGDGGDNELNLEIPEMPAMPPMPEMPEMPQVPPLPGMLRDYASVLPRAFNFNSMQSGVLGIECQSLGSQLAAYFGVKEGVLVSSVGKTSAAEKAGMRAGDVIVKIDGEAVTSVHEITSLVRAARNKRTIPVVVMRDRKEVTLNVTVEAASRGMRPVAFTGRAC